MYRGQHYWKNFHENTKCSFWNHWSKMWKCSLLFCCWINNDYFYIFGSLITKYYLFVLTETQWPPPTYCWLQNENFNILGPIITKWKFLHFCSNNYKMKILTFWDQKLQNITYLLLQNPRGPFQYIVDSIMIILTFFYQ